MDRSGGGRYKEFMDTQAPDQPSSDGPSKPETLFPLAAVGLTAGPPERPARYNRKLWIGG